MSHVFNTVAVFLTSHRIKNNTTRLHSGISTLSHNVANPRLCLFSKEEMMGVDESEMQNRPQTQSFNASDALYLELVFWES